MDPISRTAQQKMPFQLSAFFQIWAAGHLTSPDPADTREPLLSHHTLTHLYLLSVLHEVGLVSHLLYLCGPRSLSGSLLLHSHVGLR